MLYITVTPNITLNGVMIQNEIYIYIYNLYTKYDKEDFDQIFTWLLNSRKNLKITFERGEGDVETRLFITRLFIICEPYQVHHN